MRLPFSWPSIQEGDWTGLFRGLRDMLNSITNTLNNPIFDQGVIVTDNTGASPTGGNEGPGTINVATNYYKNGTAAATVAFTGAATDLSGILGVLHGGTGADLSGTGLADGVVKQTSAG